jgi:integrase
MSTCLFRSCLAARLHGFWKMRVALGRKGISERKILIYLDRFLTRALKPGQAITPAIAQQWCAEMEHLSTGTRINRISVLRQFCAYLRYFDPRTCVIHRTWLPNRTRPAPYIYARPEMRSILAAARRIGPPGSLRPAVIATLIGLLYSTGLRIGEALKLTLADVDLANQLLTVRETKFKKSRYVPLSPSTVCKLADYLGRREKAGFPTDPAAAVFVNPSGQAYGSPRVCQIFLAILRRVGLRQPKGERGPRLHDLRHTFAVTRLAGWYRHGENLNAKLPLLSTYLGHTSLVGTQVYLHATAELLEKASARFHKRFFIPHLAPWDRQEVPLEQEL